MKRPTNEELNLLKKQLEDLIQEATDSKNNIITNCREISDLYEDSSKHASKIESLVESATETNKKITTLQTNATADGAEISELYEVISKNSETILKQKESLDELVKMAQDLGKTIESFLPGATSAGLASAFSERKKSFKWPKRIWGSLFCASLIALFFVALIDPVALKFTTFNPDTILKDLFARLPWAIPIIWLAIYASRRHSQALRLEEEYAHKEALSKSFEGYKKQLVEISRDTEGGITPILDLTTKTLEAISLHPGRIYQGKHEDISPMHSVVNALSPNKKPENKN